MLSCLQLHIRRTLKVGTILNVLNQYAMYQCIRMRKEHALSKTYNAQNDPLDGIQKVEQVYEYPVVRTPNSQNNVYKCLARR